MGDGGLGKGIDLNSEMEQKAYDEMMKEDTSNSKSKKRLASEISASDQMVEEKGSAPSQTRDTNSLANKKLKKTGPKERDIDEHPLAENSVVIVEYGGKECFAHIKDIET